MMLFSDEYYTIEHVTTGQYKDRGSRFIAYAIPADSEHTVKRELELLRKKHYDATHHCYAYIIGPDKSAWRLNDDGEPSGTAGRPIYGQLLSSDLTNILVVVVRYYGGTKLGVSGLINAYRSAAADALANAIKMLKIVKVELRLEFGYENMEKVMRIIKDKGIELLKTDFGMKCVVAVAVPRLEAQEITNQLSRITGLIISQLRTI